MTTRCAIARQPKADDHLYHETTAAYVQYDGGPRDMLPELVALTRRFGSKRLLDTLLAHPAWRSIDTRTDPETSPAHHRGLIVKVVPGVGDFYDDPNANLIRLEYAAASGQYTLPARIRDGDSLSVLDYVYVIGPARIEAFKVLGHEAVYITSVPTDAMPDQVQVVVNDLRDIDFASRLKVFSAAERRVIDQH